jgi:hypothetical protein
MEINYMPFANRNTFITGTLMLLLCVSTAASAGLVTLIPPQILTIDQQDVTEGDFTLQSFIGIDLDLTQTEILSLADSNDDVVHHAIIGSNDSIDLLSYDDDFPIVQMAYSFDSTAPDLPSITSNVLSARNVFTIALPFESICSDFFELIDFRGVSTFHTTAAILDTVASGFTNIEFFNDGNTRLFATFTESDMLLDPLKFQEHGTIEVMPVPAPNTLWLMGIGLVLFARKLKSKNTIVSLSKNQN